MKGYEKISCFILLMILPLVLLHSQEQDYKFRNLSTKHGLSSNEINCIFKDSRGFIWFGTTKGLNRFDGYEFRIYKNIPNDSSSLNSDTVLCMVEDFNGDLLIGTRSGGLNRLNVASDKFTQYIHESDDGNSISHNRVNKIFIDNDGSIWLATHFGLNLYNSNINSFSCFRISPEDQDEKNNQIRTIFQDKSGILWVGTNSGLYNFDEKSKQFELVEIKLPDGVDTDRHKIITSINEDKFGTIWIGTNYWLFKITNDRIFWIGPNEERSKYPSNSSINDIQVFEWQNEQYLWIATPWGLNRYDFVKNEFVRVYSQPDKLESLSSNSIQNLYFDNQGILWVGTHDQGINYLTMTKNLFSQHEIPGKNMNHSACTFYEDSNGNIWVGSHTGGLLKYDGDLKLIKRFRFKNQDSIERITYRVKSIVEDVQKNIWIGKHGSFSGVYFFDEDKELFMLVPYDIASMHKAPRYVFDLIIDKNNRKWIGTNSGLYFIDGFFSDTQQASQVGHSILSHACIHDLCLDQSGKIWIASNEGLFSFNPDSFDSLVFEEYKYSQGSEAVIPKYILEANDGAIWIATNKNLSELSQDSKDYSGIDFNNDLVEDNQIVSIVEDNNGLLWMNTMKGLVRFDPRKKSLPITKLFDVSNGLPYDGCIETQMYISKKGKIFIPAQYGTQNGFISFQPDRIKDNELIPHIIITGFSIRHKQVKLDSSLSVKKRIILNYDENFFSFEFASLNFINPEKNQYAYYLEGFEHDWISSGTQRNANYTGVPPGNYIFRVKGSNNDGYWNEEGATINITILPPPWLTWWAYSLYILIFLGLFYAWRKYDLNRRRLKQQLEIEQLEAEKLKELDTMKSRFFANISHEFRTPLTLILGPLEKLRSKIVDSDSEQDLNMMQRNAQRLQNLINQLLNLSKLESGKMKLRAREENITALIRGYVQSFESLAKQKKVDLLFTSEEEDIKLFIDKDKIEKILYNLLSNAFKFTGERGIVEVSVSSRQYVKSSEQIPPGIANFATQWVEIKISDTGCGIPPDKLEHIFDRFYQADDSYTKEQEGTGIGLALTKELVEAHHGKILVESDPDGNRDEKGTTFSVLLPIGKEYLKSDEILNKTSAVDKEEDSLIPIGELELSTGDSLSHELQNQDVNDRKEDKHYLLIVDDNPDLRAYMIGYLKDEYYILEAVDGKEGIAVATESIPDLIISDVMMPKMDGFELCKELKSDERTCHIPVILLTARASSESKIEGLKTGADDFIIKPFDPDELQARIKNLILQREKLKEEYLNRFKSVEEKELNKVLSMDDQFLLKVESIVEQHISDSAFNVEFFAQEMAMSRVQLHRKLRALLNQSTSEFIRTIRLNKAAILLLNKSANVSEICYDVGFNNHAYFTSCFHKKFGKTPREYANQGFGTGS